MLLWDRLGAMLQTDMSTYLLLGTPFTFIFLLFLSRSDASTEMFRNLLRGVVVWGIGYVFYFFTSPLFELRYTPERIFTYYLFREFAYWSLFAICGHLAFSVPALRRSERGKAGEKAAFIVGVFLLIPIIDLITYHKILNTYYLFLLPSLRIALILVFVSAPTLLRGSQIVSVLVTYAILLAWAVIATFVPMLYTLQRRGYAYLTTACVVALAASFFISRMHAES